MRVKMNPKLLFIVIFCCSGIASYKSDEDCTEIAKDEETLLVFSTLGGGLTAIDPLTSETRWSIADEPAIKVPIPTECSAPHYLPDPRDGSLYLMNGIEGGLKKLPYTIPQLVASAPCRSSDGILYSGKKSDTWFLIDPKTGKREKVLGFGAPAAADSSDSIGWATSRSIYLGRTQYTVMMYDSLSNNKNSKPWNVTFFDYTSHSMAPEITNEYEFLHVTSSSSGLTATFDRRKGTNLWQKDLTSPVVAVFLLGSEGLLSVPFTTVSDAVLAEIIEHAEHGNNKDLKLFQTLYVGEHSNNVYAIPSLVDKNTATISSDPVANLLEGPNQPNEVLSINELIAKSSNGKNNNILVLGHYQMPKTDEELKLKISPSSRNSWKSHQLATIINMDFEQSKSQSIGIQTDDTNDTLNVILQKPVMQGVYKNIRDWLDQQPNKIFSMLLILLFGAIVFMFWYFRMQMRQLKEASQNGSQTNSNRSSGGTYSEPIEVGDGEVRVGKINFNTKDVLGKGCEGTFVFKGSFEQREVAVKRLLPECFTLADREVTLLRESDAHENVVRYFCTEQDRQFRYIAVELCAATLQDYAEGPLSEKLRQQISVLDALYQATNGLVHLHSLNIVHRDIKPQNVLLSLPDNTKKVRAMISDFGLCKKLNFGKTSFSRRSGITGTEGWIAPEMLRGHRTTTSVDIFSLGCVFYYVISKGSHPFGDNVKRQANILAYEYDLKILRKSDEKITNSDVLAEELISDMICKDSTKRPTAATIRSHPLFWNDEKILIFLQDVSDRVEKADILTDPLRTLEKNAQIVVRNDWSLHLHAEITNDIRKYRGYQGFSVRDLLRALRNKKHHYHELSPEMQKALGSIPHEFAQYWINRFPHLLSHSYHSLEKCSMEPLFKAYYKMNLNFRFTKPKYFYEEGHENLELIKYYENFSKSSQNKSPKKVNAGENKNNKRGSYNFVKQNNGGGFITRSEMNGNNPENSEVNDENRKKYNVRRRDPKIRWNLQPPNDGVAQ